MRYFISLLAICFLCFCQSPTSTKENQQKPLESPKINAPELKSQYGWLNTERPYSLQELRGKIVLLDFWTFGCINCQHILPDLERLEEEFAEELVVIGVHSAKFEGEKLNNTIRKAILKFGIKHPVVNDADYSIWNQYAVKAWPTLVLIDPEGKIVFTKSGEGVYRSFQPQIAALVQKHQENINRKAFQFRLEEESSKSLLRFPSKMIYDGETYFYIADSGNHRILKVDLTGNIIDSIGTGKKGFTNGSFQETSFSEPQGLALHGNLLYIADTKNNALRVADLAQRRVSTVAGDGKTHYYKAEQAWDEPVQPNSPWDLLLHQDALYIANAGNHQILKMDLATQKIYRFAGSGSEALQNGSLREAAFNQPSGLAAFGDLLFVADPEASAIRQIDLRKGEVSTLLGKGLFDFGDRDGAAEKALLQHALGLYYHEGQLYIADTYNHKIKKFDLKNNRVSTLVAGLDEPNDVLLLNGQLWVTDTHHHQILKIDLKSNEKQTWLPAKAL